MSRELPLPKELLHLVEKREVADRRKATKQGSVPGGDQPAPVAERRRRKRRKNPPAKGR